MLKWYNSPKQRKKRSEKAKRAANIRWKNYHDSLSDEPTRPTLPDNIYRLTFENLITGNKSVLLFHPGERSNNYKIDVDGKYWKTCGFKCAFDLLIKSCHRIARS